MTEYICAEGLCHNKPFKTKDRTKIEGHIASKHLNYFPYVCGICDDEGSELAAPTLKHLQTHSNKFHPDKTQKAKLCLDDDKDEELEEWIERVKQQSEESSEIQASVTSSSVANSTHGQHCETPSDTTVSNDIGPQPLLSAAGQFSTPNSQPTENVIFRPENFPIAQNIVFRPEDIPIEENRYIGPENIPNGGDIVPIESTPVAENAIFPAQNSDMTENINFGNSANEQNAENIRIVNEEIVVNTPTMLVEQQNVLQLPEDSILGRFLKQEQLSNPEPVEETISSDSPGFVVSEALNTSRSSFPEITSTPKPKETETHPVDSTNSSKRKRHSKVSTAENKRSLVTCQLCHQSVQLSYKHGHITVHHLDVPYYYCLYCKYEGRTKVSLDYHLRTKHGNRAQRSGTKKNLDGQIEQLIVECFGDQADAQHKGHEEEEKQSTTVESDDSIIQIYCKLCAEYIPSNLAEKHIIPLHMNGNNAFFCNYCHNLFGSLTRFDNHHSEVHPSQPLDLQQKALTYDEVYQTCFSISVGEQQENSTSKSPPKRTSSGTIECKICKWEVYKESQRSHVISNHLTGNYYHVCSYCSFSSLDSSHIWEHQQKKHPALLRKTRRNNAFENEILKQIKKCFDCQPHQVGAGQNHCTSVEKAVESKRITVSVSESSVRPINISELPRKRGRPRKPVKQYQQSNVFESASNRSGDVANSRSSEHLNVESSGNWRMTPALDQDQTLAIHSLPVTESSGDSSSVLVQSVSLSGSSRKQVLNEAPGNPVTHTSSRRVSDVFMQPTSDSKSLFHTEPSDKSPVRQSPRKVSKMSVQPTTSSAEQAVFISETPGEQAGMSQSSSEPLQIAAPVYYTKECQICKKNVRESTLKPHVIGHHLTGNYFRCGYCFFSAKGNGSIVYHQKKKHRLRRKLVEINYEFTDEIAKQMTKCFDGQPSRPGQIAAGYHYPSLSGTPSTITKLMKKDSKECCECKQVVRAESLKVHVIGHHLSEHYFLCHLCAFTSKWEVGLDTHRKKKHPGYAKRLKVNSKMEKEITKMMAKCFDGQPLIEREVEVTTFVSTPIPMRRCSLKRQFYSPKSFHDDIKKADDKIKCLQCGKKVKDLQHCLKAHIMAYHVDGDCYLCGHCSFTARWSGIVYNHCSVKHSSLESVVKSREKELSHTIQEMQQKCFKMKFAYKCEECEFSAKSFHLLNVHKGKHNHNQRMSSFAQSSPTAQGAIENQLASLTCSPSFLASSPATNRRKNFTLPIIPVSSPQKFPRTPLLKRIGKLQTVTCRLCNKSVPGMSGKAYDHTYNHLDEKYFSCPYCDLKVRLRTNVYAHIRTKHPKLRRKVVRAPGLDKAMKQKFKECFKMDNDGAQLEEARLITCRLCNKSMLPGMATRHAQTHLDKKFFCCPYCNVKFRPRPNVYAHIRAKHPKLQSKVVKAPGLQKAIEQKLVECFKKGENSSRLEKDQENAITSGAIMMDYSMNSSNNSIKSPISLATPVVFFCKKCNQSTSKPKEHAWDHLEPTPDHLPCRCTFVECPYEALSPTAIAEHAAIQHHVGTQTIQYYIHTDNNMLDKVKEIVSQCFG